MIGALTIQPLCARCGHTEEDHRYKLASGSHACEACYNRGGYCPQFFDEAL